MILVWGVYFVNIYAMPKEKLAEKLGISSEDFIKLKSPGSYRSIATKISLPLIRIYCATKFIDGEYKDK